MEGTKFDAAGPDNHFLFCSAMAEVNPEAWRRLVAPRFEQSSVLINHLKAEVDVGTFLILRNPCGIVHQTKLCRLVGWEMPDNVMLLVVNLYNVENPSIFNNTEHDLCKYMWKAVQTRDAEFLEVSEVLDICYVFHNSTVESMEFLVQGRTDSLVTFEPVEASLPFPCSHPSFLRRTSYCRRIWDEMDGVRRLIGSVLCSQRCDQLDFSRRSVPIFLSVDTWDYLVRRCKDQAGVTYVEIKPRNKSRMDYAMLPGGQSVGKQRTFPMSELVLEDMDVLLHLFGQSNVFGVRKRRPRKDAGVRDLMTNDRFSIPYGVSMVHHDCQLRVVITYELYVYSVFNDGTMRDEGTEQFNRFLSRDAPEMPDDIFDAVPAEAAAAADNHEDDDMIGYEGSLIGINPVEDILLSVGREYRVAQEMQKIIGLRFGGRMIEFEALVDGEYTLMSRQDALRDIRSYLE